ncbi:MAG TPA: DUF4129 domain-containing protein [Bacteroidales bacterium]|nr:DUF4129 domain-containing protein [Bacteroidales bacterium]HRZ48762.1 DUF4129 domain-containing protein [Bacteroidales bacterium]
MGSGLKTNRSFRLMWLFSVLIPMTGLTAEAYASGTIVIQKVGANQPFSAETWQKTRKNLDYTEKPQVPPEVHKAKPPKARFKHLKETLFIVVIAILAGLILFMLFSRKKIVKHRQSNASGIESGQEENLPVKMLAERYKEALRAENYPLAIRYFHLLLLQSLATRRMVKLSRDKTNRVYLSELKNTEWQEAFRMVTRHVEEAWFGNRSLSRDDFFRITAPFDTLIPMGK